MSINTRGIDLKSICMMLSSSATTKVTWPHFLAAGGDIFDFTALAFSQNTYIIAEISACPTQKVKICTLNPSGSVFPLFILKCSSASSLANSGRVVAASSQVSMPTSFRNTARAICCDFFSRQTFSASVKEFFLVMRSSSTSIFSLS